jgi:type I restriction enzyme S subunit
VNTWPKRTLSDLVELQRGHDLPTQDRKPGPIPIIGSFGVTGTHNEARYTGPGVAIGRSGASIGQATFVDEPYWPLNTCLFVKNFNGNDPRWIYRLLDGIDFTAFNSGSAQPSLNRNFLRNIPVSVPPLDEQRAIAEVLGALDGKIVANTKLATTASDLTAAEFAVRVRSVPFSPQTFADLAKVTGGGTPSTANGDFWNDDIPWATPTDVTGLQGPYLSSTSRRISEAGLKACASELYPAGAILMTSRATIGAFALAQVPMAVNQGFIVVQPHDPNLRFWILHEMQSRVEEFISLANGATFLELSRGNFKKFKVRLAERAVMDEFAGLAEPLHAAAANALSENTKLAATRDALLPQLMSGKLRVKDAEAALEKLGV